MTAATIARTRRLGLALLVAAAAGAAAAQPDGFAAGRTVTITVASVDPAAGHLVSEAGGRYAVTGDTVLEYGPDQRISGHQILSVVEAGMPLRLHLDPDGGEPPAIERMAVETR